jgi:hypothetical protein
VGIPKAGEHRADHGKHERNKERDLQDYDESFFQATSTAHAWCSMISTMLIVSRFQYRCSFVNAQ